MLHAHVFTGPIFSHFGTCKIASMQTAILNVDGLLVFC